MVIGKQDMVIGKQEWDYANDKPLVEAQMNGAPLQQGLRVENGISGLSDDELVQLATKLLTIAPGLTNFHFAARAVCQAYLREHTVSDGELLLTPAQEFHEPMNFGEALSAIKRGEKVTRAGWNGKGQFLAVSKYGFPFGKIAVLFQFDGSGSPWTPSVGDLFADDWINLTHEKTSNDGDGTIEANFALYVDGYTMRSTENVGEVEITNLEGKRGTVPSRQLTAFLQRRLDDMTI